MKDKSVLDNIQFTKSRKGTKQLLIISSESGSYLAKKYLIRIRNSGKNIASANIVPDPFLLAPEISGHVGKIQNTELNLL